MRWFLRDLKAAISSASSAVIERGEKQMVRASQRAEARNRQRRDQ
jgi:hypothetical protein